MSRSCSPWPDPPSRPWCTPYHGLNSAERRGRAAVGRPPFVETHERLDVSTTTFDICSLTSAFAAPSLECAFRSMPPDAMCACALSSWFSRSAMRASVPDTPNAASLVVVVEPSCAERRVVIEVADVVRDEALAILRSCPPPCVRSSIGMSGWDHRADSRGRVLVHRLLTGCLASADEASFYAASAVARRTGESRRPSTAGRARATCRACDGRDVTVLHFTMPEMDGFEFIAELRQHPSWRDIPAGS